MLAHKLKKRERRELLHLILVVHLPCVSFSPAHYSLVFHNTHNFRLNQSKHSAVTIGRQLSINARKKIMPVKNSANKIGSAKNL